MGINLEEECRRFEEQLEGSDATGACAQGIEYRASRSSAGSPLSGVNCASRTGRQGGSCYVERIRRDDRIFDPDEIDDGPGT